MSIKGTKTTTSGMEWNSMLGLLVRLKNDGRLREYLLISLGCYTGLRIGDMLTIQYKDVLDKDEFIITESKTGKQRKITINRSLKEAIRYAVDNLTRQGTFNPDDFMFCNKKGIKFSRQFANHLLSQAFKDYNVKVQNPSSHTLRKTFGKRVWEADNKSERALVYLSEVFSHSTLKITKLYIGVTDEVLKGVYLNI